MNILLIGFTGPNQTSRIIAEGLRALHHHVRHIDILKQKATPYLHLSAWYKHEDVVIVFQTNTNLINDLECRVIYYHAEILSPASLDRWDYLVAGGIEIEPFLNTFAYDAMCQNKATLLLNYGIIPEEWTPREKCHLMPSFIGNIDRPYQPHWLHKIIYTTRKAVLAEIKPLIQFHPWRSYQAYKDLLASSIATIIIHGEYCYLSQRIFEAAASACCPIIYTGNSSEAIYEELGLVSGYNCIFFDSYHTLKHQLTFNMLKLLGQRAREWALRQTATQRAQTLLDWYLRCETHLGETHVQTTLSAQ